MLDVRNKLVKFPILRYLFHVFVVVVVIIIVIIVIIEIIHINVSLLFLPSCPRILYLLTCLFKSYQLGIIKIKSHYRPYL